MTDYMTKEGTQFLWQCRPQKIEKCCDGRLLVSYVTSRGESEQDTFDTVMMATGRCNTSHATRQTDPSVNQAIFYFTSVHTKVILDNNNNKTPHSPIHLLRTNQYY